MVGMVGIPDGIAIVGIDNPGIVGRSDIDKPGSVGKSGIPTIPGMLGISTVVPGISLGAPVNFLSFAMSQSPSVCPHALGQVMVWASFLDLLCWRYCEKLHTGQYFKPVIKRTNASEGYRQLPFPRTEVIGGFGVIPRFHQHLTSSTV